MIPNKKIVISASRRTDIPAFYLQWFMEGIGRGYFEVINPYNQRKKIVNASPEEVHSIVFWSKNFGPFIKERIGEKLQESGYHLFFNFTINSENHILEPNVPSLKDRLDQLEYLSHHFDPRIIHWRFDPICFYRTKDKGNLRNNLDQFSLIAEKASRVRIERCITSFMDHYPKISKRTHQLPGFSFADPPCEIKQEVLMELNRKLADFQIKLYTCCEKELLKSLPPETEIENSSCIPNDLLLNVYGGRISTKKDTGQRIKNGCGCMISADIGSYNLHPCEHGCLFCYANPSRGISKSHGRPLNGAQRINRPW